jgi:hypothetical protein
LQQPVHLQNPTTTENVITRLKWYTSLRTSYACSHRSQYQQFVKSLYVIIIQSIVMWHQTLQSSRTVILTVPISVKHHH